jgi:hypothetical protein
VDLFDSLWNAGQQRQISELRSQLDRERLRADLARGDHTLKDRAAELKLRLGLLMRLLIAKGVITAEKYCSPHHGDPARGRGAGGRRSADQERQQHRAPRRRTVEVGVGGPPGAAARAVVQIHP